MKKEITETTISFQRSIKSHSIPPLLILISVLPGSFLSHFSAGLVNVALPDLSIVFQVSLSFSQWVVTGYLLAVMLFLPIMGKVADMIGKKKIHYAGYVVFGVGVILSAVSPTLYFLLVARVLQGIGAAMLQAVNMAIITENYPKEKRGKALGLIGASVGVGGLLGPPAGGILIHWFSWDVLFWIQIPLVLLAFVLSIYFVPNDVGTKKNSFDVVGAFLFGVGIISIVYVLNQIGEGITDSTYLLIGAIGIISLILFSFWVKKFPEPFINMTMFSHPFIRTGLIIIVFSFMATFSTMVVIPFYLRGVLELSSTLTGVLLMSYPLLLALIGPISGALSDKIGSFKVVIIGMVLMIFSLIGLGTLSTTSSLFTVSVFLCLLGVSMGILTSPNYNLVMSHLPLSETGSMGGNIALFRNLGMTLGTALGVTFMNFFANGSITKWMTSTNKENTDLVMIGFHSLFLLLACFISLMMARLIWIAYKYQEASIASEEMEGVK
ncbi:MFS transporter [Ureibacillus massiliensis]|uniref:MFS transporter n=1 Tax=Ureibacillus massiliensis TaxID=292806 RepID=UPI00068B64F2|nr:MFS transporter [Ureibacillus massiliensis]